MLQEELTPCASLLYDWILRKVNGPSLLKVDIRDFQAWSAEFREFPYTEAEIFVALRQLKQLELINVAKTELTIRAKETEPTPSKLSPPKLWQRGLNPWLLLAIIPLLLVLLKATPLSEKITTLFPPKTENHNQ